MRASVAALLVLAFLAASCVAVKPALSSTGVTENSWVQKAPMQVARSSLGVAVVNGRIYAIGGTTENGVVTTNEEYNPETDTWTLKTSMPTPRAGFATAVYQNKIYCIGGSNHTGVNEVYDPATDSWTTKASIPTGVSIYASAVVDSKIYFIDGVAQISLSNISRSKLNQIYDATSDSWSLGTPFPSTAGFYGVAGATTGVDAPKRIYALGRDFHLSEQQYVNGVYDPEQDSWSVGAVVPTNRYGLSVAVLNDKLYAIGGYTEAYSVFPWEQPTVTYYATNEAYTPFGYGTVPPEVTIVSPENSTYASSNVSLALTVNKPVSWLGYSLDGQDNITITGNTTLTGLTSGLHNIIVYAKDEFKNTGASDITSFTVAEETFPTAPVAAASAATVGVAGVALLIYFKKRKQS